MEIITMILSGLALLAASASLILTIREKKRNEERNAAVLQYADAAAKKALNDADTRAKESATALYKNVCEKYEKRLADLENGIVPNFEEAKQAVSSVNDFNRGLNAILGFDPFDAMNKQREKELYSERG